MISKSADRVTKYTAARVNERIRERSERSIAESAQGGPEAIREKLYDLDREWDIERAIETQSSALSLLGLFLGKFVDKRWYLLTGVTQGFLLQHALQGWCPPVPPLRRLGFRTAREIEDERNALIQLEMES